jgi:hypothetical protein
MKEINNACNNSVLSFEELKSYIESRITELDLSYYCEMINNATNSGILMDYCFDGHYININYQESITSGKESYIENYHIVLPEQDNSLVRSYNDTINISLIHLANHEIEHVLQNKKIHSMPKDNMSKLLNSCINIMRADFPKLTTYYKYHDKYLIEYQANAKAGYITLNENVIDGFYSNESIYIYNCFLAKKLLEGYIGGIYYLNEHTTPLKALINLAKYLKSEKEYKILSSFSIKEKKERELTALYNLIKVSDIIKLVNNDQLENNVNDLLLGRKLPNNILNEMNDISLGRVRTLNIYEKLYHNKTY